MPGDRGLWTLRVPDFTAVTLGVQGDAEPTEP